MNGKSLAAQCRGLLLHDCSLFLKGDDMNRVCRGVTVARNCTLKANDVRSKFLQNGIPILEGIPSTLAISYIDIVGGVAHGWY